MGRYGESIWTTHDPSDNPMTENPTTVNPTPKKNKLKEEQSFKNSKRTTAQNLFNEFWKEYPRKLDKGKAVKAFASALTRANLEDILAGAIQYKNDPNRIDEFTKYPASWLNKELYESVEVAEAKPLPKLFVGIIK